MQATSQIPSNMSAAERLVRQYYQTIEGQPFNEESAAAFFSENYQSRPPRPVPPGASAKQGTLGLLKNLSIGIPDAKRDLLIVEPLSGDRVLVYFSFTGTHTGPFFGAPPSGNKVSFIGVDIFTIKDGKFVENWHVEDLSTFLEQLKSK